MMTAIFIASTIATLVIQAGVLFGAGLLLYNAPSIAGLVADKGVFDIPFINGIEYFVSGLAYAKVVAFILAQLFCIIGLVWNAFKLWAGAAQIKKTVIDIGARLIIFSFVFTWYASITMNLLGIGTGIGEMICGGKEKAVSKYSDIVNIVTTQIESYDYAEMANFNILKNKNISEKQFNKLYKNLESASEKSKDAIKKELETNYNIKVISNKEAKEDLDFQRDDAVERLNVLLKNKMALMQQAGTNELTAAQVQEGKEKYGWIENKDYVRETIYVDGTTIPTDTRFYKLGDANQSYEAMVKRFATLCDFFGVKDEKGKTVTAETYKKMSSAQQASVKDKISDWFSGLYLDFDNSKISFSYGNYSKDNMTSRNASSIAGFNPQYISPGAIVKLSTLCAELIRGGDDTREFNHNEPLWMDFLDFIIWVIEMLLITFSGVLIAIDYIIMILEYHIVTTISYIFLPLMLFEGTRQYAIKLVGTFISFFVRVVTFMAIFYYCIDTYMNMLYSQFAGLTDPGSVKSFSYVILSLIICLMLIQKAPQLAQTILSGSPSLSSGDLARTGRGLANGARMGIGATRKVMDKATAGSRAVNRAAMNTAAGMEGGNKAKSEAIKNAKKSGITDGEELRKIGKSAKDSWLKDNGMNTKQQLSRFVGNLASQNAFGIKDNFDDMKIGAGIGKGQGTSDQHKLTVRNMKDNINKSFEDKNSSESQPSSEASKAAEQKPIGKAEGKAAVRAGDTGAKSPDYPETAQGGSSGMTGSGSGGAGSAAGGTEATQKKPQPASKRSSYTPPAQASQGGGSTQKPASNGVAKQQSGNTAQKPSGSRPKSSATPKHPQSGGKPYSRKSGHGRRK